MLFFAGAAALAVGTACSADATQVVPASDAPGDEGASDPGGASEPGASPDSAIIFSVLVRQPDSFIEYLTAQPDVPDGDVDLSRALELPGGNYYAQPDAVYYGNFETKSLQRYQVNADYSVSLTGEVSFINYDVDFLNQEPLFFSPTLAYYVDAPRAQIVTFDPSAMLITGEMAVPELFRDGYEPFLGDVQKVGDRYLGTVMYSTEDSKLAPDSTIGIILQDDPEQPVVLLRDERGMGAQRAFVDAAGDFYALADAAGGWVGLTGLQEATSPRVLRVKNGASVVDPDYLLDLGELLDTPAVNGLWPVSSDTFAVQAWASGVDPRVVLADAAAYDVEPYFDWWLVNPITEQATRVNGMARGVPSYTLLQLRDGEQTYVQQYVIENGNYDEAHVELYALGADATARQVAQTSRGDLRVMARVSVR
ncbi:MAG TPA: hypothetical protein VMG12_42155 [Polyangiaceae bacterium]|nr:hypothetical protein [Polyangiaceae bacterium]